MQAWTLCQALQQPQLNPMENHRPPIQPPGSPCTFSPCSRELCVIAMPSTEHCGDVSALPMPFALQLSPGPWHFLHFLQIWALTMALGLS